MMGARIDTPLARLCELLVLLEARQINRLRLREALERGTFDAWPELEEHHRKILETCGLPEQGALYEVCPEGLSPGAEALWRLGHLRRLGCPRGDLEELVGRFAAITGTDFVEVAGLLYEDEEVLRVRA